MPISIMTRYGARQNLLGSASQRRWTVSPVTWSRSRDCARRAAPNPVKFEIIYEPSERLYEALDRFKIELKVPYRIEDMATEIKRTAEGVTSLWDNDRWADSNEDLVRSSIVETKNALRDHAHLKSPRAARQLAESIWSPRRNRRGRGHEINPDLLLAVLEVVERIADRKLTYSRKRTRRAPLGVPTSGPAEGTMLDV